MDIFTIETPKFVLVLRMEQNCKLSLQMITLLLLFLRTGIGSAFFMRKLCFTILTLILIAQISFCQQKTFEKESLLGLQVSFHDFTGADSLRNFGKNLKA